jgi:hypothetical protein
MIIDGDMQVRRVYMDVPHSAEVKPSWYGESVDHYEGRHARRWGFHSVSHT